MKTILIPVCFFAFATTYAQTDTIRTPELKKTDSDIRIIEEEKLKLDTSADKTIRRSSTVKLKSTGETKSREKIKSKTKNPNTNQKKSDVTDPTPPRH